MADITDIRISFSGEEQAAQAELAAKDLIRLSYALRYAKDRPAWLEEASRCATLSQAFFAFRDHAAAYDPMTEFPYCALSRVRREGALLFIDRCGDLVRDFLITGTKCFFPQLCVVFSRLSPQAEFKADCRYEMTVSGGVTLTMMHYDGQVFRTKEMYVEWPREEDDWSGVDHFAYAIEDDGALRFVFL